MNTPRKQVWVYVALLCGVTYLLIGRAFAAPTDNVRVWRLAAWVVSGVVFAAHIWYEQFRLRSTPRTTALHAASGAAIGSFALAVAGMIHSFLTTSTIQPLWLAALVLWPAITAVPAFLVALVMAAVLARFPRRVRA